VTADAFKDYDDGGSIMGANRPTSRGQCYGRRQLCGLGLSTSAILG
jgi:hypothetical protein